MARATARFSDAAYMNTPSRRLRSMMLALLVSIFMRAALASVTLLASCRCEEPCQGYGHGEDAPERVAPRGAERRAQKAFARLVLSRRPSFSPIAGEQWFRVYEADPSWSIVPGLLSWDGEISSWRLQDGTWQLSDVRYFEQSKDVEWAQRPFHILEPEKRQITRFAVMSLNARAQSSGSVRGGRAVSPCAGAEVTLVAGRYGTPTSDAPTGRSGVTG